MMNHKHPTSKVSSPWAEDLRLVSVSNLRGWAAAQPFKGSIEPLRLEKQMQGVYGEDTTNLLTT